MESVATPTQSSPSAVKAPQARSDLKFPVYTLIDALAVPRVVHEKAGGAASTEQLAAYLEYKSPNNGAFVDRVSAARLFGLVDRIGSEYVLTARAKQILMPESDEQARQALVEAFMAVPLFKAVYEAFRGTDLPQGIGMKNALLNRFHVVANRSDVAERTLMKSAEAAGLFSVRGNRSQLIIPPLGRVHSPAPSDDGGLDGGSGGGGNGSGGNDGGPGGSSRPSSREELQNEYIAVLLKAFKAKLDNGEFDSELGDKIEKLTGLTQ